MDTPTSLSEEPHGQETDLSDRDAPPIWSILGDIDRALVPFMGGVRPETTPSGLSYALPLGVIHVRIDADSRLFVVRVTERKDRMTSSGVQMLSWVVGAVTEMRFMRLLERYRNLSKGEQALSAHPGDEGDYSWGEFHAEMGQAYALCAKELERTIAGETPPPAGESWPELFEEGGSHE